MYAKEQLKICAEYRDMLPRPRLICQEPGPRQIGLLICITLAFTIIQWPIISSELYDMV